MYRDLCLNSVAKVSKAKTTVFALVATLVVVSLTSIEHVNLKRRLSQYFGNGQCLWEPPTYDVPENITFTKTLVAGFPTGDKRLTFVQMEALTGLSARDEWDFAFLVSILHLI